MFYIANPLDEKWNDVEFEHVGFYNGLTYVKTTENVIFAEPVELPTALAEEVEERELLEKNTVINNIRNGVNNRLNKEAVASGYDSIDTAVSYAAMENEYQTEAITFFKWRSKVWVWANKLINDIEAGKKIIVNWDEMPSRS